MSGREQIPADATRAGGADWVVRLQSPQAAESDWIAFEAWLRATPGGRAAFDEAMSLWLLADARHELADDRPGPSRRAAGARRARWRPALAAGLLASGLAVVASVLLMIQVPVRPSAPHPATPGPIAYATARAERRTVMLADGSRIELSGASRVMVSLDARQRRVVLTNGEAAFSVAHDPARPFTVIVGDRQVRDVGTQFDIRRAGRLIEVTVRRGSVEVASNDATRAGPILLRAGLRLRHDEGTAKSNVQSVSAEQAFAWERGELIYRDQTLGEIVDDLNRYFPDGVRVGDRATAELRFSGVLAIGDEAATMRRLTGLLPISATRINGATVLMAREDPR